MDKSFTGLLEEVAAFTADPETFGPDDRFTLGEDFEDLGLDGAPDTDDEGEDNDRFDFQDDNGNGFHDAGEAGEPYLDTAGADTMVFMTEEQECFGDACFLLLDWPPYRFRVDYGEDVMVPMGPAQWGEVEDYLHGGLMDYDTLLDVRDADDDDVDDIHDNSPFDFNPGQEDLDGDGIGDVSDPDDDNDGIVDTEDNSPKTPNAGQEDTDKDGDGDTTDPDDDGDGIADTDDNCPVNSNTDQDDCDADGTGDLCAIAEGASQDCNLNTMPDTCDITMGASLDVDENGVPDECEYNDCNGNGASDLDEIILGDGADCNTNGVLDSCDVTDGTSDDADGDGTLDECDFPDCNDNGMSDDADLVLGTSLDCNANELPDECDIAEGTSLDSNGDGVPDECAFEDCNVNGVADPTDISSGTSEDCNGNGIPDECEAAELVASEDFNVSPTEWTFLGNAAYNASEGDIRLVHSDVEFAAGVAFLNDLGLATDAFEVEFDFEMTAVVGGVPDGSGDSDPDGLAFIVTGAPVTAPGYNGYGLGYKNFPVDSFAVEFDTFQNFVSGQPDDPDSNHVAIDVGGKVDPSIATAYVQPDFEETGVWHGRVRFLGGELTVWATPPGDSEMKLITATIPAANIPAVKYIGFGAGTGINSADTDVDNVVITLLTNDCNANGVPDGCDIDDGASADANANGLPDVCESCEGDANGDGGVDPLDSGFVSARFGCPVGTGDPLCDAADVNGDGVVDPLDVGYVKARFGTCQN